MNKFLASASLIVLSSTTVFAADLPVRYSKAPPPVMAPVFNWTGCYVGVHVGAGAMHESYQDENGTGALAGGQLGCNYQDGNWVFGVEGEGSWSGIKMTNVQNDLYSSYTDWVKNQSDFSISARAGIAFDRTFVYGKAGWVWGKFDISDLNVDCPGCDPYSYSRNGTLDGLLLGVGIEHALTNNWTVKLEYNYLKFGTKALNETYCDSGGCVPNGTESFHADKQLFKVGANYLFHMGSAPLVAKY